MGKLRRLARFFGAAIAASSATFALCTPASAAVCGAGSLADYLALGAGGCQVGGLTFSGFSVDTFPGPTAQQIAPGSISLSPLANGLALSSAGPLDAAAGELLGLRLLFAVSAPSLVGGSVALGDPYSVSGDGVITAYLDAAAAGLAIATLADGLADTPASFASAPFASYSSFLELGIDGGTAGSASLGPQLASVTFATTAVNAVPTPGTASLSLLALLALACSRRAAGRQPRVSSVPRTAA